MSALRRWATPGTIIVLGVVLVGAVLRVLGTRWGLPYPLHADEWVIVSGAIDLAQRNSFEPTLFMRPDHVEIKLSYLAYTAYAVGFLRTSVEAAYAVDPGMFLWISRLVTALLGTAMIVVGYFIGRRFSKPVGVIAAVVIALFPPFVRHSTYATPDIPLALATMILILACMSYLSQPGYASLLVASAAVSVSIAIKYPGAISASMIAIVVIVAAVREKRYRRILSHGATAIAAVIAFLFVISPVLFTNVTGVILAIRQESRSTHVGADGLGWGGNLWFYVEQFALASGILLALLALVGIAISIRNRDLRAIPLTIGFITWIILSALALHWERWAVTMYLSPIFFAAFGAYYGYRFVQRRRPTWTWLRWAAVGVTAVIGLNLLVGSAAIVVRQLAPDSRVALMGPFAELGVDESNSIFDGYSPLAPSVPYVLVDKFEFDGDELVPLDESKEYAVLSSCNYVRFDTAEKYAPQREIYDAIREQFEPVLVVESVAPPQRSVLEPLSIIDGIRSMVQLADDGLAGCDISVYRL